MEPSHSAPMILRSPVADGVLRANGPFIERLGLSHDQLGAKPLLDWIHPEDRATLASALKAGEGTARARHESACGHWESFDWQVKTHDDTIVALGQHVSQAESARRPTSDDGDGLRSSIAKTLKAMALIVEAKNPGLKCSVLLLNEDKDCVTVGAGPSLPDEYNALVEGLRIGPAVGSCGTAAFWNVPVIVEDIENDTLWAELRDAAKIAGVSACWSHPVTTIEGVVLGAMALYDMKPGAPTQRQMDGLEIAARMVGLAVERDRLEEQLRQSAKMKALGVLAGGVAHDFNNMLMAVTGNAELALSTLAPDAEEREMMTEIVTASHRAMDLCNQMLAYAGRGALSTETLDCNALLTELGGLLRVALSKKASLVNEHSHEPLGVVADRTQLRQVLMNLITNASDAIGHNDGTIVIRTSATELSADELEQRHPAAGLEPGEYVLIEVSDTGAGMSAETQGKIFDPFFTTKSHGHGLGLAAVQGIVRGHGGVITLESTPGQGTTFRLMLPRVPVLSQGKQASPDVRLEHQRARILVVDDEAPVRKVLRSMLERFGHEVLVAEDGLRAIEVFKREGDTIDCVLLDLSMPKLDGEEVFGELRAIRHDIAVILSSGFMEQDVMDRLRVAGFAGFIQKPAELHVLMETIGEVLRKRSPEAAR